LTPSEITFFCASSQRKLIAALWANITYFFDVEPLHNPSVIRSFIRPNPQTLQSNEGVLSSWPIEPGNTRIRTTLPFLIEVDDK
jgi:hypothetical protein